MLKVSRNISFHVYLDATEKDQEEGEDIAYSFLIFSCVYMLIDPSYSSSSSEESSFSVYLNHFYILHLVNCSAFRGLIIRG